MKSLIQLLCGVLRRGLLTSGQPFQGILNNDDCPSNDNMGQPTPHVSVRKKGRESEKEMAEQEKPEKLSPGPAHPQ